MAHRCMECGQNFKRRMTLERHTDTVHTMNTRYECTFSGCTRKFRRTDDRDRHEHNKHGIGKVMCQNCEALVRQDALERHQSGPMCRQRTAQGQNAAALMPNLPADSSAWKQFDEIEQPHSFSPTALNRVEQLWSFNDPGFNGAERLDPSHSIDLYQQTLTGMESTGEPQSDIVSRGGPSADLGKTYFEAITLQDQDSRPLSPLDKSLGEWFPADRHNWIENTFLPSQRVQPAFDSPALFTCSQPGCSFTSPTAQNLWHHQRYHLPESLRPGPCPQCDRRFHTRRDVERHLITHTTERRYFCTIPSCLYATKGFGRKDHLTRHTRAKHPAESTIETGSDHELDLQAAWEASMKGQPQASKRSSESEPGLRDMHTGFSLGDAIGEETSPRGAHTSFTHESPEEQQTPTERIGAGPEESSELTRASKRLLDLATQYHHHIDDNGRLKWQDEAQSQMNQRTLHLPQPLELTLDDELGHYREGSWLPTQSRSSSMKRGGPTIKDGDYDHQMGSVPAAPEHFVQPNPALLQQTLDIFREKNADPSLIPQKQLYNLSMQPVNVQAQSIEIYSQSIQQEMQVPMKDELSKLNRDQSMSSSIGLGEGRGHPPNRAQPLNAQAQSEVYSYSIQQQMQATMNKELNRINNDKGISPSIGPSKAQDHLLNQAAMDGVAAESYFNSLSVQHNEDEESAKNVDVTPGQFPTLTWVEAAYADTRLDLDSSRENIFEEDLAYTSGAESIEALSTGSDLDTFAASSIVPLSGKESSTQPTSASASKGELALGDEKNARHTGVVDNFNDAESIKTDNREIGMLNETKMKLSRYFAKELYSSILATQTDGYTASRDTISALPELLRQYSLLAEHRVRSSLEQRAAAFVRHRRKAITAFFESKCGICLEGEPQENRSGVAEPDYVDRMKLLWRDERTGTAHEIVEIPSDQDLASIPDLEEEDDDDDDEEDGMSFPPDIEVAINFLLAGEECQWLLNQLNIASRTMTTGDAYMQVRRSLSESLAGQACIAFEVFWNPLTIVEQQYTDIETFDLGLVVCLSGTAELAQATTCKEYIDMMWPSIGTCVLSKLNQLIRQSLEVSKSAEIDDDSSCIDRLTVSNDCLIIQATGSQTELLELGEVLVWLGAACRASESDRITYCSPRITHDALATCAINYEFSEIDERENDPNGGSKCWLKIFNNPSIVKGYPIRLREQNEPGLEIPLNMAAVLGYAQFATSFNDHFLLKGPCSALVPRMQKGASITWHYTVNDNQEPLTYEQAIGRESNCPKIDLLCLEGSRHFVGWTPSVRLLTGTKYAEYDNIGYGGSFIEKPGHALSEVVIGGGYKCFNIGGTFVPGTKDYHHFQGISGPYELQIRLAGRYNVVLYDVADRRGWLLDGTSLVLHLARAALSHPIGHFAEDSGDRLISQFKHLDQIPNATKRVTAKDVLLCPANRHILMFQDLDSSSSESEKASTWRFEDLVIHYCNILDKIRGHQIKLQQSHQWKVQNPLAKPKTLEGFGFLDILQMEPDLRPRAVKLTSSASHWLKMTEKAGAINILGSNLGDLMAPLQGQCEHQLQVPCGVDFLCAPVGILKQIAMKRCGISENSYQLAEGITWDKPSASFANASCFCSNNQKTSRCNATSKPRECHVHVTELGSSTPVLNHSECRNLKSTNVDYQSGAVILGRRCDLAKAIRRLKRPSIGDSEDMEWQYETDKASHDSGVDVTSIGRSSTSR